MSVIAAPPRLEDKLNDYGYNPGIANRWFYVEPDMFRGGFLPALTSQTGGSLLELRGSSDLGTAFARIVNEFRTRYLLTYSPEGVTAGGWHDTVVRLKEGRADTKARRGYQR